MRSTLYSLILIGVFVGLSFDDSPDPKQPITDPQIYNLVWYGVDTNARTQGPRAEACGAWDALNPQYPNDVTASGIYRTATPLLRSASPCNPSGPPILPLSDDIATIKQHAYWFAAMGANGVIIDWTNQGCSDGLGGSEYAQGIRDATRAVIHEFNQATDDHPQIKVVIAMRKWEEGDFGLDAQSAEDEVSCIADEVVEAYDTDTGAYLVLDNGRLNADTSKPLLLVFPKFTNSAWQMGPQWSDSRFDVRFSNGNFLSGGEYTETLAGSPCVTASTSVCRILDYYPYWPFVEHVPDPARPNTHYKTLLSNYPDASSNVHTEMGTARMGVYKYGPDVWDGNAQNALARTMEPFYSVAPQVLTLHSFNYATGQAAKPDEGISVNSAHMLEPSEDFGYNLLNQATQYFARARGLNTFTDRTGTPVIAGWSGSNVLISIDGWPLEYRVSQTLPNEAATWQMVKPSGGSFAVAAGTSGTWYVQTRNSFGVSGWLDVNNTSATPTLPEDVVARPDTFTGAWPGFTFGTTGDIPFMVQLDPAFAPVPAVYRPSNQHWYFKLLSSTKDIQFGGAGDIPQVVRLGTFDHVAVYRPSTGQVHINTDNETFNYSVSNDQIIGGWSPLIPPNVSAAISTAVVGSTNNFTGKWNGFSFGLSTDRPLLIQLSPGSPKLPVVFRPRPSPPLDGGADWYIQQGGYSDYSEYIDKVVNWGLATDKPIIVIWTDGKEHLAVCRSSTVYVNTNNESWNGSNYATFGTC